MMKSRNIKFILLFLGCTTLLTSCNSDSLGNEVSDTISSNLFPNIWSTLAQILATIILFSVIIILAYKPAKKYLNKRKELLNNESEEALQANKEAQKSRLEAEEN